MDKTNATLVFRVLKKMSTPFVQMESYKAGVINSKGDVIVPKSKRTRIQEKAFSPLERMVIGLKKASAPDSYVSALRLMKEYVENQSNKETVSVLMERMENHNLINPNVNKHDLSTYEGFMDAVDEVMSEMFSGASLGGPFDGAQSNADANSTGMAAPTGPTKKKKKSIETILKRR
jgi:hypothetical protein